LLGVTSATRIPIVWREAMAIQKSAQAGKHDLVQVKNPRTDRYVKIDRTVGTIVSHKSTKGPYKDVPVARKRK